MSEQISDNYLLIKRGLYWKPNSYGYTGIKAHAGRYTKDDAERRSHSYDEPVTHIREDEAPMFSERCTQEAKLDFLVDQMRDIGDFFKSELAELKTIAENADSETRWSNFEAGNRLEALLDFFRRERFSTINEECERLIALSEGV